MMNMLSMLISIQQASDIFSQHYHLALSSTNNNFVPSISKQRQQRKDDDGCSIEEAKDNGEDSNVT
eukprot:scaffold10578_cov158-Skeletonema_menzelii.AAC.10